MRTRIFGFMVSVILLFFALGCSGRLPVAPGMNGERSTPDIIEGNADSQESSPAFLGLYQINLDTDDMSWSVEPIRKTSSNDVLESVDITQFLTSTPCKDCVRIFNLGINSDGYVVMGLGIKHPFPQANPSLPITGRNRADLHVFNVEGTLLTDLPELIRFPSEGLDFANGYLVNPDGYTTYLDPLFDCIVPTESEGHPYILHFDDYSHGNFAESNSNGFADVLNPTGNLVMKMGSDYSIKDYIFDIPAGGSMNFAFAVGCTFGFTTTSYLYRLNPVYRLPQHNKKAASEIHVEVTENNLKHFDLESSATLRIEVMDINHATKTGLNKDQLAYESRVAYLSIDVPALGSDIRLSNPDTESGDGRNGPLVYEITVQNEKNAGEGNVPCFIKIKDSYPIRSNPNPALAGADIMGRLDPNTLILSYVPEFATYQIIYLHIQPCDGVEMRSGVTPIDMGVDGEGNNIIAYSDNEVWKYDVDFCTGEKIYKADILELPNITRMDCHNDGRTIIMGPAGNC